MICQKKLGDCVVRKVESVHVQVKRKCFNCLSPLTERFKKSFAYAGTQKWNSLPGDLQSANSKAEFKSKVSEHITRKSIRLSGVIDGPVGLWG